MLDFILEFLPELVVLFVLVPLLCLVVYWIRKIGRLKKSLVAASGDEFAMNMERTRLKARAISVLGAVASFAFYILLLNLDTSFEMATGLAILCFGLFGIWARTVRQQYTRDFKDRYVTTELSRVFDDLNYQPDGVFAKDAIVGLKMFSGIDRVRGNDLIRARYKGIAFEQGDIALEERHVVTVQDQNGNLNDEERWEGIFRGRVVRFDLDAPPFRGPVQVVRRDFSAARVLSSPGDWQQTETELATFGEAFEVFSRDPLDAMSAMTPQMIEGIHYLNQKIDVPLAFHFEGKSIYVFMALSRDAFDPSGKKTLLEEQELLQKDMELITGFLDSMYIRGRHAAPASEQNPEQAATPAGATDAASVPVAEGGTAEPSSLSRQMRKASLALHGPFRMLCDILLWLPLAIWGLSVMVGLVYLPDEIALSFSMQGGETTLGSDLYSTLGYLLIGAVFLVPSCLFSGGCLQDGMKTFLLGGGRGEDGSTRFWSLIKSVILALLYAIPLWLHLAFVQVNMAAQ